MGSISYTGAPDAKLMRVIGQRLRALREAQGLSTVEAAARSRLSRRTVYRAEQGHNPTLATLLRLLRLYGRLGALDDFIPEPEVSPMALLEKRRGKSGG